MVAGVGVYIFCYRVCERVGGVGSGLDLLKGYIKLDFLLKRLVYS